MEAHIAWILAGFALIIAELLSGTFYLLVLGVAAFAGAGAAWGNVSFGLQVLAAAAVAIIGMVWLHQRRKNHPDQQMASLDAGQPVPPAGVAVAAVDVPGRDRPPLRPPD